MQMNIQHLSLHPFKRVLVMSDLHGEITLFKQALTQAHFSKEDCCIVVGDLCEKGENSLALIRYVMELQKEYNIYCVMGNCDTLFEDVYDEDETNNQGLKDYLLWRKQSLLNEMCAECGIQVHEQMDVEEMKHILRQTYQHEFHFLEHLPQIIETEDFIFVHAGLQQQSLDQQDPYHCLTTPAFMDQDVSFEKTVMVGHWPVCNYQKECCVHHIRIDTKKNIIGLDGGNTIKPGGQVNVLLIDQGEMSSFAVDHYPKIIALENQQASEVPLNLTFPYTACDILERNEHESWCYLKAYQMKRKFRNEELFERNHQWYCVDQVIADLEIKKNDSVSLILEDDQGVFVKKNGYCGWYHGRYHKIEG